MGLVQVQVTVPCAGSRSSSRWRNTGGLDPLLRHWSAQVVIPLYVVKCRNTTPSAPPLVVSRSRTSWEALLHYSLNPHAFEPCPEMCSEGGNIPGGGKFPHLSSVRGKLKTGRS